MAYDWRLSIIMAGLLVLTSCFKYIEMGHYQKMPKIETVQSFKQNYGKTVKLLGTIVQQDLKNKKVVVAKDVFFMKLSDDMLILLPTQGASDLMINHLQGLIGKKVFAVGQPNPPEFPVIYEGLKTPSFASQGFITAVDDKMLLEPQIANLETLNTYREYMKDEESFFAYLVGSLSDEIPEEATFPLTIMVILEDQTSLKASINNKSDLDILGYDQEKVFIKGKIKSEGDGIIILDSQISNYEKYMDYYSVE